MKVMKKFTDKDISDFCSITNDSNPLHSNEYMSDKDKRPIVPGMLTFCYAASLNKRDLSNFNCIDVCFGSMVSSDEIVTFQNKIKDDSLVMRGIKDDKDIFSDSENNTRFYNSESLKAESIDGILRKEKITDDQITLFGAQLSDNDSILSSYLFSIAYASKILITSIKDPISNNEKFVANKLNEKKGILPAYNSLNIRLVEGYKEIEIGKDLSYVSDVRFEGKRDIVFDIQCSQGDSLIYQARYDLVAIPEKIILRAAKGI